MEDQAKKEMEQKYNNLMKKAQRGRESYTESSFRGLEIDIDRLEKRQKGN